MKKIRLLCLTAFVFALLIADKTHAQSADVSANVLWSGGRHGRHIFTGTVTTNKDVFSAGETMQVSTVVIRTSIVGGAYDNKIIGVVNGVKKDLFTGAAPNNGLTKNLTFVVQNTPGVYSLSFETNSSTWLSGASSISYTVVAPAINGSCGSSNGQTLSSAPTSGFCSSGTYSGLSGSGPWSWSCIGANGGSSSWCSAQKLSPPPVYNCSIASPTYSFTKENFQSYNATCPSGSNIGWVAYSRDCNMGTRLSDPFGYSAFCVAPTVSIWAAPNPVTKGSPTTISWSTSNASSCWATNGWTGWKSNTGGSEFPITPSVNTNYTIECWNAVGASSGQQNVTVNVACTPDSSCAANTCTGSQCNGIDASCNATLVNGTKTDGVCCVDSTWSPSTDTKCTNETLTQTSNCNRTRSIPGTKQCSKVNGWREVGL
jgi:hypothetical protein